MSSHRNIIRFQYPCGDTPTSKSFSNQALKKRESAMNCLRFSRKLLAPVLLGGTSLAIACANAQAAAPVQASCHLQSAGNKIKRVVHLQFDNVHLRRDNPNVPSDLEQMPHLLNFLTDNGTVS